MLIAMGRVLQAATKKTCLLCVASLYVAGCFVDDGRGETDATVTSDEPGKITQGTNGSETSTNTTGINTTEDSSTTSTTGDTTTTTSGATTSNQTTTTSAPTTDPTTSTTADPTKTTEEPTDTTTSDSDDPTSSTTDVGCIEPMADCDDNPYDCEANTDIDVQNCGGCGLECDDVCVQGECLAAKFVFVTKETYDGDLDGLEGANTICKGLADDAELPGDYFAWLATLEKAPLNFLEPSSSRYVLRDGTIVANNSLDLLDGDLDHPIDLDQYGDPLDSGSACSNVVWSNVAENGAPATPNVDCLDWTSASILSEGAIGQYEQYDADWTFTENCEPRSCNAASHLYCFQQ